MNTLTDLYEQTLVPMDAELEKQAAEMVKEAEEEDAAGRIMARGFADELNKIAMGGMMYGPGGGMGPSTESMLGSRRPRAPKVPSISKGKGRFGKGSTVAPSGEIKPPKPPKPSVRTTPQ